VYILIGAALRRAYDIVDMLHLQVNWDMAISIEEVSGLRSISLNGSLLMIKTWVPRVPAFH
jgi:hypothetical protein